MVKMKIMKLNLFSIALFLLLSSCYSQPQSKSKIMENDADKEFSKAGADTGSAIVKTDAEWKKLLSPEVYYVAREKGTERPFTSKFETFKEVGTYYCAVCGNPLFKSDTRFESGCGWPSFYEPISKNSVIYLPDNSYGMKRTEVECGRCKSHLGHVFEDGPPPTGLRYCINGVVLDFKKAQEAEKKYNKNN